VRFAGGDPQLVLVPPEREPAAAEEAFTARITLRLPESVMAHVEAAAAREGVSVNTWIVRALGRAASASTTTRRVGRRMTGYAES
jgi:hypothetical protein